MLATPLLGEIRKIIFAVIDPGSRAFKFDVARNTITRLYNGSIYKFGLISFSFSLNFKK